MPPLPASPSAVPPRGRSFGAVATAYAEHRPGYPEAAVDWALEPISGARHTRPRRLLDLGRRHREAHRGPARAGRGDRGGAGPGHARRAATPIRRRRRPPGQRRGDPAAGRLRGRGAGRAGLALVRHRPRAARDGPGAAARWGAGRAVERRRRRGRVGGRLPPGGRRGAQGARCGQQRGAAGLRRARRVRVERVRPVPEPGADHRRGSAGHRGHPFLGAAQRCGRAGRGVRPDARLPGRAAADVVRGVRAAAWPPRCCARCAGRSAAGRARSGRARIR